MRVRKQIVLAGLIATLTGIGVAGAQPTPDAQADAPVDVSAQQDVSLAPQQMLTEARQYLPAMDQGAAMVKRQLARAREERDVVKSLCLNDKLTQINVAIRSAQDRLSGLRNAVSNNDEDRARHEFTVLQVLRDRVRTLVTEANQCIGEEVGFVGESRVTVEIDPNIADTDPTEVPSDPVVSQPPVTSSPVQ